MSCFSPFHISESPVNSPKTKNVGNARPDGQRRSNSDQELVCDNLGEGNMSSSEELKRTRDDQENHY